MSVKPAARVGDMTSHGTPLGPGPGSTTITIDGKPAWRALSDAHACPLSDGPKPHGGGTVVVGSTSVLVDGLPIARVGDLVVEVGPPNAIVTGSTTFLVGDLSTPIMLSASMFGANILPPEYRFDQLLQGLTDGIAALGDYMYDSVKDVVLGEFSKDPTGLATVAGIALGFVPIVGQIMDIRDTIAAVTNLMDGENWKDPWKWGALAANVIGFVPFAGDFAKSGMKKGLGALEELVEDGVRKGAKEAAEHADDLTKAGKKAGEHADDAAKRADDAAKAAADDAAGTGKKVPDETPPTKGGDSTGSGGDEPPPSSGSGGDEPPPSSGSGDEWDEWDDSGGRGSKGKKEESSRGGGRKGKKPDIQEIDGIAKEKGIDRDEFGKFLEEEKAAGNRGTKNQRGDFTRKELEEKAEEFKNQNK